MIKSENVVPNILQSKQLHSGAYLGGKGWVVQPPWATKWMLKMKKFNFPCATNFYFSERNTRKFNGQLRFAFQTRKFCWRRPLWFLVPGAQMPSCYATDFIWPKVVVTRLPIFPFSFWSLRELLHFTTSIVFRPQNRPSFIAYYPGFVACKVWSTRNC